MAKQKKKTVLSAEEFDRRFDNGEDMSDYIDWDKAKFVNPFQRINIDLPPSIVSMVDREASRIGVTRTSLIKMWISERVDRLPPAPAPVPTPAPVLLTPAPKPIP